MHLYLSCLCAVSYSSNRNVVVAQRLEKLEQYIKKEGMEHDQIPVGIYLN